MVQEPSCQKPFEIWTKTSWFWRVRSIFIIALAEAWLFENRTIWNMTFKKWFWMVGFQIPTVPYTVYKSTWSKKKCCLHLRKFVHINLPLAGFELGSPGMQAALLPIEPPLLVILLKFTLSFQKPEQEGGRRQTAGHHRTADRLCCSKETKTSPRSRRCEENCRRAASRQGSRRQTRGSQRCRNGRKCNTRLRGWT